VAGLFGRNHAAVDLLLQQGVIARVTWNSSPRRPVEPGIADMRDRHHVVVEQCHHQGRAHAGILRLALRRLVDRRIGLGDFGLESPHGEYSLPAASSWSMGFGLLRRPFPSRLPSRVVAMPLATSPAL
jgi:hypothetical protein